MAEACVAKQELLEQEREATEQAGSTTKNMAGAQTKIFSQLCEDLHPLAAQWRTLGTQLNISAAEQNAIEGEKNRCQNCLEKVLQEWLTESEGPHTKALLVEVLKKKALGQTRLAGEISRNKDIPDDFDTNKEESLKVLSDKLSKIAHKYSPLGIQLLDDPDIISQIESRVIDVESYLTQILKKWRNNQDGDLPLSELLEAVRSKTINNQKLARELEDKWTQKGFLVAPLEAAADGPDGMDIN
ncbi:hypothetical protein GBAR_LOCUS11804 [Geodia barretti]|uniref:Death domain-containing protein n=1 Tax=Geodia barretti TaxID=519541 RepID=A0AA35RYN2_GEOBA|nr:hypothetical protein GBAR_LOCUS11804 [Geodia barretti]